MPSSSSSVVLLWYPVSACRISAKIFVILTGNWILVMEAVSSCGLSDYTLAMTENKCEEILRQQLLVDKMDQNSLPHICHTTWRRKQNFFRNALICKPWVNKKYPKQSALFLDGLMLACALGTVAQWHNCRYSNLPWVGSTIFSTTLCSLCMFFTHCVWRRRWKSSVVKWGTILRSSFYGNVTQRWLVVSYRRFG